MVDEPVPDKVEPAALPKPPSRKIVARRKPSKQLRAQGAEKGIDHAQKYVDEMDALLKRASVAGVNTEKLLAKASMKRGASVLERFTDAFFDALEGKSRK